MTERFPYKDVCKQGNTGCDLPKYLECSLYQLKEAQIAKWVEGGLEEDANEEIKKHSVGSRDSN